MAKEEDFQKIRNALRKNVQERNDIAHKDSKERAKHLENTIKTQADSIVKFIAGTDHFNVSVAFKKFHKLFIPIIDHCS